MFTTTLRPGYLVALSTRVTGNISYTKTVNEEDHIVADGGEEAEWTTRKRIDEPAEHKAATKLRSQARAMVANICSKTNHGLLCPDERIDELRQAVIDAQAVAASFNSSATLSRIEITVMAGRVVQDDVQAVEAINAEVRQLLTRMQDGIRALDPEAIRAAANQARGLGQMLSDSAKKEVQEAVAVARAAAKEIVKAADGGIATVDELAIKAISRNRHAFLDLDEGETEVAAPVAKAREVEVDMDLVLPPIDVIEKANGKARELDIE